MIQMPRRRTRIAAGLLMAVVLLLLNYSRAYDACGDSSGCVTSTEKDTVWRGLLIDGRTGRPLPNRPFDVRFASRRQDPVTFRSDGAGRFCVVWACETIAAAVDPPLMVESGARGRSILFGPEHRLGGRPSPPPPNCERTDEGIPWHRSTDLRDRWQWTAIQLSAPLAIVLLLLGAFSRAVHLVSLGVLAAAVLWSIVIW
jgi:hypothetical protein